MPRLQKLREKFASRGLEVVGVCLDANADDARAYVRKHGYTWPQIFSKGSMESETAVRYGIISLPYLILVDAGGRCHQSRPAVHATGSGGRKGPDAEE